MAVATPILEKRKEETQEEVEYRYTFDKKEDEFHNSMINERYQQLINAQNTMSDLRSAYTQPVQSESVQLEFAQVEAPKQVEPYFVDNARTNSPLFLANSAVNNPVSAAQTEANSATVVNQTVSEEENENTRPSRTTMQYISGNEDVDVANGSIATQSAKKHINMSKRDKAIIGVVISVIIALFVLIIVNSAMISSVNRDIGTLQSSLTDARESYEYVSEELAQEEANFENTLEEFARENGMSR